tara:strand:+ start:53552 stop:55399 length:1848 start_codon:yes stop_codon:yes gene_type:complete
VHLIEDKVVLIVGLGLIGGSVARGLAAGKHCRRIIACGRDETALQTALLDGTIDAFSTQLETVVPQADIILITTPTLTVARILEQIRDTVRDDTIITDAASVKASVLADAHRILGTGVNRFIAGHPIAGSEQSGYRASRADLYNRRKVILTPVMESDPQALRTVMQLWQCLGAEVHAMSANRHDRVLAGTSHLPHLLAYTLVNTLVEAVGEEDRPQQVFDYAAGGFADFSRIASSDPRMWRDIFLANQQATVDVLDSYVEALQQMKLLLLKSDGDALEQSFHKARRVRDDFIRRFRDGGDSAPANGAGSDRAGSEGTGPLIVRPGIRLAGTCRLAASHAEAINRLMDLVDHDTVWQMSGFPEDRASLRALQGLRTRGVPVSGPERGELLVFGARPTADRPAGRGADSDVTGTVKLPADPFLLGTLALATAILPGSAITVADALAVPGSLPPLLGALQSLGLNIVADGRDLHFAYSADAPQGNARLDVPADSITADEYLVLVAAGLRCREPLQIHMAEAARLALLPRIAAWCEGGADIRQESTGALTVSASGTAKLLSAGQFDCHENSQLSLLTIALATAGTATMTLISPGDISGHYPGLQASWRQLGIDVRAASN